ncbi:hypothetical protein, partial [Helicobacter pylori]|uniref:hypothetical protein n=1 Tax=Helicobacter pylori TaxID=210 RepID=UPI0036F449EC
ALVLTLIIVSRLCCLLCGGCACVVGLFFFFFFNDPAPPGFSPWWFVGSVRFLKETAKELVGGSMSFKFLWL